MEDNIKRLVSEATRLNREAGVEVDANVIAYVACLQEVQKVWDEVTSGASMASGAYGPPLIATLAQHLCKVLQQKDSPYLSTSKMQVMMEVLFRRQRLTIDQEQSDHDESANMLARCTRSTRSTTVQAYEKLHKLIVEYVCIKSSLDRALSDEAAGEEVKAAVESVFPLSSLARFLTLGEEDRLQQIEELARITLGICLFNRHTGAGGLALPLATQNYLPQAQRLQRDLMRHSIDLASDLQHLHAFHVTSTAAPDAQADAVVEARSRAELEALHCAQALTTFQQLSADLSAGLDTVGQLEAEIQHILIEVTETIGLSAAISKEVIYPMFDRLGTLHVLLGQELRLLVVRQRLYDESTAMLGGYRSMLPPKGKGKGGKNAATSPWASKLIIPPLEELAAQELASSSLQDQGVPPMAEGLEYMEAPIIESQEQLITILQGISLASFCPVALAQHGSLRLAKPPLGLIKVAATGQVLGFSSPQALWDFAQDPATTLAKVDQAVITQPLLAKLLGRPDLHPALNIQSVVDIMAGPLKVDFGCQTPVHFLEKHIDYSYEWNAWALRRRALALANLRQKRTHSTQTVLSHFKRDEDTQVWVPKQAQVQTRVDKGQTMPKKLQYVSGLRGAPNTKMNVIRLELDLGQPHQH